MSKLLVLHWCVTNLPTQHLSATLTHRSLGSVSESHSWSSISVSARLQQGDRTGSVSRSEFFASNSVLCPQITVGDCAEDLNSLMDGGQTPPSVSCHMALFNMEANFIKVGKLIKQ